MHWFVPERITYLYYAPVYGELTVEERLDYNRLHAAYCGEMLCFFESEFPGYVEGLLKASLLKGSTVKAARELIAAERRHAAMFGQLNRDLLPELYEKRTFFFVGATLVPAAILGVAQRWPHLFPVVQWVALLQEERAGYLSDLIAKDAASYDPRVVSVFARHGVEEAGHVDIDQDVLRVVWDESSATVRAMNARLFRLVVRHFLTTPKHAGVKLIHTWIDRHPNLRPRRAEIAEQFRRLPDSSAFRLSVYSRQIVPRTFALLDRSPEFKTLGDALWGYEPEPVTT